MRLSDQQLDAIDGRIGPCCTHTKKHGERYHGYKLSISVDAKHKVIRKITVPPYATPA